LAAKTYATTAQYDTLISNWFLKDNNELKTNFLSPSTLSSELRYGENPHQSAGIYKSSFQKSGIPYANLIQGKELSYNNINDADAALQLIKEFDSKESAVAIIKHANPCGVACGKSLVDAYEKAFSCDTTSAFGGIIAVNQTLDEDTAKKIIEIFTEVIIVPDITEGAKKILQGKNNIRVLVINNMNDNKINYSFKSIEGGILVQSNDNKEIKDSDLKIVTKIQPTNEQKSDMLFAFKVCKHVKSNAIIYVKNKKTIGIGAGQMSRVDSAKIASKKK
jgi:phosphoribosylaminoimidazolecarboxamide formyltransferase/IMP cyclohydrolase